MPSLLRKILDREFAKAKDTSKPVPYVPRRAKWGLGDEMHQLLAEKGYHLTKDCPCLKTISDMNNWGLAGIRKKENYTSVLDSMVKEAKRRNIRVLGLAPTEGMLSFRARRWIVEAIRRYKKRIEKHEVELRNNNITQSISGPATKDH